MVKNGDPGAPTVEVTPIFKKGSLDVETVLKKWDKSRGGINPAWNPSPFGKSAVEAGNLAPVLGTDRLVSLPADLAEKVGPRGNEARWIELYNGRGSVEVAWTVAEDGLDMSKVDRRTTRLDQALYLGRTPETCVRELGHHGTVVDALGKVYVDAMSTRVLDLMDPVQRNKFIEVFGKDYKLGQETAHWARMNNYDAIRYESTQNPGGEAWAMMDPNNGAVVMGDVLPPTAAEKVLGGRLAKEALETSRPLAPPAKSLGAAAKTDFADPAKTTYEYVRPDGTVFKADDPAPPKQLDLPLKEKAAGPQNRSGEELTIRYTTLDSKHRGKYGGFDDLVLEKNHKKLPPEQYRKLENTFNSQERVNIPTKDPTTGKMFLQIEDKTTGVQVDLDGQGNVIRITDPAATPHAQAPPLNKSNPTRAGPDAAPQAQSLELGGPPVTYLEAISKAKIVATGEKAQGFIPERYRGAVTRSFDGSVEAVVFDQDVLVYRHWGSGAKEAGSVWFSPERYSDPSIARSMLALPEYNSADKVSVYRIPAGTIVLKGKVASQIGESGFGSYARGGGVQVYVPNPRKIKQVK